MSRWYAHRGRPSSGGRFRRIMRSRFSYLSVLFLIHHSSAIFCDLIVTCRLSAANVRIFCHPPLAFSVVGVDLCPVFDASSLFADLSDISFPCMPMCPGIQRTSIVGWVLHISLKVLTSCSEELVRPLSNAATASWLSRSTLIPVLPPISSATSRPPRCVFAQPIHLIHQYFLVSGTIISSFDLKLYPSFYI